MIPFSLLQIRLYGPDHTEEVRALELSPTGFTFRLPRSASDLAGKVQRVQLRFVHVRDNEACTLVLSDHEIRIEKSENYYIVLRLTTNDADFRAEALRLSREYLDYIEAKLYLEDAALSNSYYPEYPTEENITCRMPHHKIMSNCSQQDLTATCNGVSVTLREVPLGIILRTPADRTCFLQSAPASGLSDYFASKGLAGHPLSDCSLRYVYAGDAFCPLLFPSDAECVKLLEKAGTEDLSVTFLLAPVPESMLDVMCERVAELADLLEKTKIHAEIETGDIGMLHYCETLSPFLKASAGILMNRKVKDPRMQYQDKKRISEISGRASLLLPKEPQTDDVSGTAFSENTSGFPVQMPPVFSLADSTEHALYLPYYQTNTATFCTLQAVLRHGRRGDLERITKCAMECEHTAFFYPDHLNMTGRGNSLLGCCSELLEDITWMENYRGKRIILNL